MVLTGMIVFVTKGIGEPTATKRSRGNPKEVTSVEFFFKVKHSKSESLLYWSLAVTKFVSSFKESGKEVVTLLLKRL